MSFILKNVSKVYGEGNSQIYAIKNMSLEIPKGKLIVILGQSGSGKSTLINLIGCMDRPTSGQIIYEGLNLTKFSKKDMSNFRKEVIGFIFQNYSLLPDLNAFENVELTTEMNGFDKNHAIEALELVGLKDRMDHFPSELSGGEQQRVSIARAIAKKPKILLCDEPTGALDSITGVKILEVIKRINEAYQTTILLITHNQEIAKIADVVIKIKNGEVIDITHQNNPATISEVIW